MSNTLLLRFPVFIATAWLWMYSSTLQAQSYYFPPLTGQQWESIPPEDLQWCDDSIQSLYDFLEGTNTHSFMLLQDGKIVLEKYFGTFSRDSFWYWASAGKTLTTFLIGTLIDQGVMHVDSPSSAYLGKGWSSLTLEQEAQITLKHHLNMTTGLDYQQADQNCTSPECLTFLHPPGTFWYYYNAPYLLLQTMIEKVTGQGLSAYTFSTLSNKTGIAGIWNDGVFFSRTRAMARFGSLMLNNGRWNLQALLQDQDFVTQAVNTSQNLNPAYGYLWWLNGKERYRLPQTTFSIPGKLIPNAPDDLVAAMGKNDQKLYLIPSRNWVVVRMGNNANESAAGPSSYDNQIWEKLSRLTCDKTTALAPLSHHPEIKVYPNPSHGIIHIDATGANISQVTLYSPLGQQILTTQSSTISLEKLPYGRYQLQITTIQGKKYFQPILYYPF